MKLCIFDIDGTLLNSLSIDDGCYRDTFQRIYKIKISDNNWLKSKKESSGTDTGILNWLTNHYLNKTLNSEDTEYFKEHFHKLLQTEIRKYSAAKLEIPGANQILDLLNEQGFCISIATGSWYQSAILKLYSIGILENRFPISASDNYQWRKDIVRKSIKQSEEFYFNKSDSQDEFAKIIYIGDGLWDLQSAQELNIEFLGINYKKSNILKNAGAELVFENHLELKDYFAKSDWFK